jgi:hypothetical protein
MSFVTLAYSLNTEGRRADLLAGGSGPASGAHRVESGSPLFARAVALAAFDADGCAVVRDFIANSPGFEFAKIEPYSLAPTPEQLLADMEKMYADSQAAAAAEKAKREARESQQRAEALARGAEYFTENGHQCKYAKDPDFAPALAEARRLEDARRAAEKADDDARRRAEEQLEQERAQAIRMWAIDNGSDLVRERMAGGFEWESLAAQEYVDSILASIQLETAPSEDCFDFEERQRTCPTLPEMQELKHARALLDGKATASLIWGVYSPENESDDEDRKGFSRAEIKIEVVAPNGGTYIRFFKVAAAVV